MVNPSAWTGRPFYAPTPLDMLRLAWRSFLYPSFECTNCIGMIEHGCYCDAMGASAPGVGPQLWRMILRGEYVW